MLSLRLVRGAHIAIRSARRSSTSSSRKRIDTHLERLGVTRVSLPSPLGPAEIRDTVLAWEGRRRLRELTIQHHGFAWEQWRRDPMPWLLAWDQVGIPRLGLTNGSDRLVTEREPDGTVFVDATLIFEELLLRMLEVKELVIGRVRVRGFPWPGRAITLRRALAKIPRVELREGWAAS